MLNRKIILACQLLAFGAQWVMLYSCDFVTRNQFERKTARVWLEIHQQQLQGEEALVLWLLCKHDCDRNKVGQLFYLKKCTNFNACK